MYSGFIIQKKQTKYTVPIRGSQREMLPVRESVRFNLTCEKLVILSYWGKTTSKVKRVFIGC